MRWLHFFLDTAKKLIEEKGDEKALCLALAKISGYTRPKEKYSFGKENSGSSFGNNRRNGGRNNGYGNRDRNGGGRNNGYGNNRRNGYGNRERNGYGNRERNGYGNRERNGGYSNRERF